MRVHDCGILHTDVKPSNILLRIEDNRCTLVDFQFCVMQSSDGTFKATTNTYASPNYRPLEMWRARTLHEVTQALAPSLDIWSYGVVVMGLFPNKDLFSGSEREVLHTLERWENSRTFR